MYGQTNVYLTHLRPGSFDTLAAFFSTADIIVCVALKPSDAILIAGSNRSFQGMLPYFFQANSKPLSSPGTPINSPSPGTRVFVSENFIQDDALVPLTSNDRARSLSSLLLRWPKSKHLSADDNCYLKKACFNNHLFISWARSKRMLWRREFYILDQGKSEIFWTNSKTIIGFGFRIQWGIMQIS